MKKIFEKADDFGDILHCSEPLPTFLAGIIGFAAIFFFIEIQLANSEGYELLIGRIISPVAAIILGIWGMVKYKTDNTCGGANVALLFCCAIYVLIYMFAILIMVNRSAFQI